MASDGKVTRPNACGDSEREYAVIATVSISDKQLLNGGSNSNIFWYCSGKCWWVKHWSVLIDWLHNNDNCSSSCLWLRAPVTAHDGDVVFCCTGVIVKSCYYWKNSIRSHSKEATCSLSTRNADKRLSITSFIAVFTYDCWNWRGWRDGLLYKDGLMRWDYHRHIIIDISYPDN